MAGETPVPSRHLAVDLSADLICLLARVRAPAEVAGPPVRLVQSTRTGIRAT